MVINEHIKNNQGVLICFTVGGFENLTLHQSQLSPAPQPQTPGCRLRGCCKEAGILLPSGHLPERNATVGDIHGLYTECRVYCPQELTILASARSPSVLTKSTSLWSLNEVWHHWGAPLGADTSKP